MSSRLFDAAQNGDLRRVQDLISNKGLCCNVVNKTNQTPLHIACDWGHLDVVKYLLQCGASVNVIDNYGRTPLYLARREGFAQLEELLVNRGALADENLATQMKNRSGKKLFHKQPTSNNIFEVETSSHENDDQDAVQEDTTFGYKHKTKTVQLETRAPSVSRSFQKTVRVQVEQRDKTTQIQNNRPIKDATIPTITRSRSNPYVTPRIETAPINYQKHRSRSNPKYLTSSVRSSEEKSMVKELTSSVEICPLNGTDELFFHSTAFSKQEAEFLMQMKKAVVTVRLETNAIYFVMTRTMGQSLGNKVVMLLHGFGWCQTGLAWVKMVQPLWKDGWSVILVDLPGFGRSSGENIQTKIWKNDGPDIFLQIITALNIKVPVSVFGYCGGAATFMRAFVKHPHLFSKRHVLHNCVIGEWPVELDSKLQRLNTKLFVTWTTDIDHSKLCVAYKHLAQLRKTKFPNITFVDTDEEYLGGGEMIISGVGRANIVSFFDPCHEYIDRTLTHLKTAY